MKGLSFGRAALHGLLFIYPLLEGGGGGGGGGTVGASTTIAALSSSFRYMGGHSTIQLQAYRWRLAVSVHAKHHSVREALMCLLQHVSARP